MAPWMKSLGIAPQAGASLLWEDEGVMEEGEKPRTVGKEREWGKVYGQGEGKSAVGRGQAGSK